MSDALTSVSEAVLTNGTVVGVLLVSAVPDGSVTDPPDGVAASAVAVLVTPPASMSACVIG